MYSVLAIELICVAQALELLLEQYHKLQAGTSIRPALDYLRKVSPIANYERTMESDIEAVSTFICDGHHVRSGGSQ